MSTYSTYDYKQILTDYDRGKLTPEMAVGHSLQHIGKLYEAQTEAKASRAGQQSQIDALEKRVNTLQAVVDRLTAFVEKIRRKPKPPNASNQPKTDQP